MTSIEELPWFPGSFTKNFGWGDERRGLSELHSIIRIGFDRSVEDTPRRLFRERVKAAGKVDYIPVNFFLFNKQTEQGDLLIADELVFHAINFPHTKRFDKLALFAFNLSMVGSWKGADANQAYPALWSSFYVAHRLADQLNWDAKRVSAKDIASFVKADSRYQGKTATKLSTNLAYLYRLGRLAELDEKSIDRWWVDCLFLALDRIVADRIRRGQPTDGGKLAAYLSASHFHALTGRRSIEKDLAVPHLISLYEACGGALRFAPESVRERTNVLLPDAADYAANDATPIAAIHRSNPAIIKALPRACAMLARYVAHFEVVDWQDLETFDVVKFVKSNLQLALDEIDAKGRRPNVSVEDYLKLIRDTDD